MDEHEERYELNTALNLHRVDELVEFLEEEIQRGAEELGVILPTTDLPISPFSPDEDRGVTWSDLYLTTGVDLPLELRAVFLAITYSRIPWNLANAMALHTLVHGKESPSYVYGRTFWEEYHRKFWERASFSSAFATDLGPREDGVGGEYGFLYFHRGRMLTLSTKAVETALGKSFGYQDFPTYWGRHSGVRGVATTWTRMERMANGGDRGISWEEVLMDIQVQAPMDSRALSNRVAMIALENVSHEKQITPGAPPFNEVVLKGVDEMLYTISQEYTTMKSAPALFLEPDRVALGKQLVDLQENLTEGILEEFGSLVQEYNVEWALAAMDWSMEGREPSQVTAVLENSVVDSPWSAEEKAISDGDNIAEGTAP